jgi:hypothetical protein
MQLPQQQAREHNPQRRDGLWIMSLGTCAATRVGGSPALLRG